MKATVQCIESEIRQYAAEFLQSEYGEQATEKLSMINITAVDVYDDGGVSEATETEVKLAAKRDIDAGHLTETTKLILRHELGHILDESQRDSEEFKAEMVHEKIAWDNAKPKTAAEKWYRNLSIRTHLDPLKMMAVGFPRPETKVSLQKLQQGTQSEITRMHKSSTWVDETLAERYAMANLIENPDYYNQTQNPNNQAASAVCLNSKNTAICVFTGSFCCSRCTPLPLYKASKRRRIPSIGAVHTSDIRILIG